MIDLETERARASGALKLAESARLRALQSQLNPHFIFNALNGITTLIRDKDGTAAAAMVDALSDFLRSMLKTIEVPEVSVAEELRFINQYLSIQRFRFGSRLQTRVEADREALGALIPTFILQPLVENAVRHGVLPREEGGSLCVLIRKSEEMLLVSVEDDGPGFASKPALKYGVGLGNSVDRLSALYGDAARLSIGPRHGEGGGFSVVLRIPFREAPEARSASGPAVLAT
jgi:LytS/YehU family sensor histidine kinase